MGTNKYKVEIIVRLISLTFFIYLHAVFFLYIFVVLVTIVMLENFPKIGI